MFFLLPFGNDRRTTRFPAITYSLIAVNVLVFLWLLPIDHRSAMQSFGLIPIHPSIRSIITSMFVHADPFHLAWNMLFLWLFGPNVEDALGRMEYTIFYFGSGVAAGLLHILVSTAYTPSAADIPMVGASGAIAGILGVFAIRFYKTRIKIFYYLGIFFYPLKWGTFTIPALIGLELWFVQQLFGGLMGILHPESGGVAYWSHIGGMIFGAVLAAALRMGVAGSQEYLMTDAMEDLNQGSTLGAAENLEAFLTNDPDNADVHGELGKIYAIHQDASRALPHFRRSIDLHLSKGDRHKAVGRLAEMRHYFPNTQLDLRSQFQLARYLLEVDCHEPALQLFDEVAAAYPGTPEGEMSLMKAGELAASLGDRPRAVLYYQRFLRQYPESIYRAMVEKALAGLQTD